MSDSGFVKLGILGEGAFGVVHLIQDKSDKAFYALKCVDLGKCNSDEKRMSLKETDIMKELDHKHVLKMITSYINDINELCILTEYCEGGDLAKFLQDSQYMLPEELIVCWVWQMASALAHMHSRQILHRDVKPPNIYLTVDANVKLGDMGIARVMDKGCGMLSTMAGTPCYMSPELFSSIGYNSKTDIWSFGCVVYETATKERAYDAPILQFIVFQVISGKTPSIPDEFSAELQELVRQMLSKDPDARPTADQIIDTSPVKEYALTMKPARDIIKSSGYSTLWGTDKSQMQTAATQMRLMKPEHIKIPLDSLELIRKRLGRDVQPVEKKADAKREDLPQGYNTILAGKTRTKDKSVRKVPTFVSSCAGGVNSEIIQTIMTSMLDTVKRNTTLKSDTCGSDQDTITPGSSITLDKHGDVLLNQIIQIQRHCAQGIGADTLSKAYHVMSYVANAADLKKELETLLGERFQMYGEMIMVLRLFELAFDKAQSSI